MDTRLVLKSVTVDASHGQPVATVEVVLGDRTAVGHADAVKGRDGQLALVGEATVRAAKEFLPPAVALVLDRVVSVSSEAGQTMWAKVLFETPDGTQPLWGISPMADDVPTTAAKAVLSAINRRTALVLGQPDTTPTPTP